MIIHRVDGYISANTTLNPCNIHHFGVPGVAEMDASKRGVPRRMILGCFWAPFGIANPKTNPKEAETEPNVRNNASQRSMNKNIQKQIRTNMRRGSKNDAKIDGRSIIFKHLSCKGCFLEIIVFPKEKRWFSWFKSSRNGIRIE